MLVKSNTATHEADFLKSTGKSQQMPSYTDNRMIDLYCKVIEVSEQQNCLALKGKSSILD